VKHIKAKEGRTMSLAFDTMYKKDIQSFRVERGSSREIRYKIPYASTIVVRISASQPVDLTMAGPHIEQAEIVGTREFKFSSNPGNELVIRFQGKSGFFAKPSDVTVEIEMYTAKEATKVSEEVTNLLELLRDLGKDYYDLNKEYVQDVLKRLATVWKILDDETKAKAKELMTLAKKFEEGKA
jgi:carbon monoxide dehydrogenase subunit G